MNFRDYHRRFERFGLRQATFEVASAVDRNVTDLSGMHKIQSYVTRVAHRIVSELSGFGGCPLLGGKADMTVCGKSLSRSLLGVKRTWLVAAHMSAFDPKRTWTPSGAVA